MVHSTYTARVLAAVAAVGQAVAFAPSAWAPAAVQRLSTSPRISHASLALRMVESNPLGSLEAMRNAALKRADGRQQIENGEAGVGAKSDAVGLLYVEVEGEFIDDGYVDEKRPSFGQGSGAGLFGGLFGGNVAKKQADAAMREQQRREMDVIQFVDEDAKPGLMHKRPSYFDPDIIGSQKNSLGLYSSSGRQGSGRQGSVAPAPLPAGWYTTTDQATGKEYYYTEDGKVTWERPQ